MLQILLVSLILVACGDKTIKIDQKKLNKSTEGYLGGVNHLPKASFKLNQSKNDELVITAENQSSDEDGIDDIVSYLWATGDGAVYNTKNLKHRYSKPGNYTVSLTVTDKHGISSVPYKETIVVDDELAEYTYNYFLKSSNYSVQSEEYVSAPEKVSYMVAFDPELYGDDNKALDMSGVTYKTEILSTSDNYSIYIASKDGSNSIPGNMINVILQNVNDLEDDEISISYRLCAELSILNRVVCTDKAEISIPVVGEDKYKKSLNIDSTNYLLTDSGLLYRGGSLLRKTVKDFVLSRYYDEFNESKTAIITLMEDGNVYKNFETEPFMSGIDHIELDKLNTKPQKKNGFGEGRQDYIYYYQLVSNSGQVWKCSNFDNCYIIKKDNLS